MEPIRVVDVEARRVALGVHLVPVAPDGDQQGQHVLGTGAQPGVVYRRPPVLETGLPDLVIC